MQIQHCETLGEAEPTGTCSVVKGSQTYMGHYVRGADHIRLTLTDGRDNIPAGETVVLTVEDEQLVGFFDPSGFFHSDELEGIEDEDEDEV